jgi:carbon-monoxide dehydrogenase medium subunit
VGITGVTGKAYRASRVEKELKGKKLDASVIARAAAHAAEGIQPLSDLHASGTYRAAMAEVYTRRALSEAVARAQEV